VRSLPAAALQPQQPSQQQQQQNGEALPPAGPPLDESRVGSAVGFLQSASIGEETLEEKRAFLREKGLAEAEIAEVRSLWRILGAPASANVSCSTSCKRTCIFVALHCDFRSASHILLARRPAAAPE